MTVEPYHLDPGIVSAIERLKNTRIADQESAQYAIHSLETLGFILEAQIKKTELLLDESDKDNLFDIYWKLHASLSDSSGVNFCQADNALKTCCRFIPLLFGLIYDGWPLTKFELPEIVRGLI